MDGLNSAASLAAWVRQELGTNHPDPVMITRVIARETDRWLDAHRAGLPVRELVTEPARTGDARWDALLEGVVAYRCGAMGIARPAWTRDTRLDVGWNPFDDSTAMMVSPAWALLDTLETPAPILDKGVTWSYRNMELA